MLSRYSLTVLVIAATLSSCSTEKPQTDKLITETISTPGVLCGVCVKNIEKAVGALYGIADVEVDPEDNKTAVRFDSEKTTLHNIEAAIAAAGYDANGIPRNPQAYENLAPCCKIDG
jgi:copper chaperone